MGGAAKRTVLPTREFQVMGKPIGPLCNLACAYCYYLRTEALWPAGEPFRMSDDVLEAFVVE